MSRRDSRSRDEGLFLLIALLLGMTVQGLPAQQRRGQGRLMANPNLQSLMALGYASDGFTVAGGGLSGDPAALGNLDLLLHLSLDALPGLRRTQMRVHAQHSHGRSVSSRVGDLQGVSNLEAESGWRLYEAWLQRQIIRPGLSVLVGIYDVNSEFDVMPAAGEFLNSSFGFGTDYSLGGGGVVSTFPSTGLAARIRAQLTPSLYALLAASDGASGGSLEEQLSLRSDNGALLSFEAGYVRGIPDPTPDPVEVARLQRRGWGRGTGPPGFGLQRRRPGRGRFVEEVSTKVAVGGWTFTRPLEPLTPGEGRGRSWGVYALGEHALARTPDGARSLSAFARVGTAAEKVNRVDFFLGGGLRLKGPLASRPEDGLAVGMTHASNGSPFLRVRESAGEPMEEGETVLELTYRAHLGERVTLQPDLQWIMNPGTDPDIADALVLGIRAHVLLEHPFGDPGR